MKNILFSIICLLMFNSITINKSIIPKKNIIINDTIIKHKNTDNNIKNEILNDEKYFYKTDSLLSQVETINQLSLQRLSEIERINREIERDKNEIIKLRKDINNKMNNTLSLIKEIKNDSLKK